jgi:Transglutaminase-like superfamily
VRSLADLQRLAGRAGCELVGSHFEGAELVGDFECPDINDGQPMATAKLLEGLTLSDPTSDPLPESLVDEVGPQLWGAEGPETAHAFVQARVRFEPEEEETFQTPTATFTRGAGDCDDSSRALLALAAVAGIPGRYVYFLQDGQPAHVVAQLWDGPVPEGELPADSPSWQWAETTIDADFGEHPFAAYARLGKGPRPDLDGTAVILNADDTTTRMGAMTDQLVQRTATPVTAQTLANALASVWPSVVAAVPGQAIQMLVAQSAFETGAWKYVWNYNLGNVRYTGGTPYFMMKDPGDDVVPTRWRAYSDLASGAKAWLSFLANNYSAALAYAQQGDVANFVASLKAKGYFTAPQSQYQAGVQSYYNQYSGLSPNGATSSALAPDAAWGDVQGQTEGLVGELGAVASVAAALVAGLLVGYVVER